jgi:hypothetical protein
MGSHTFVKVRLSQIHNDCGHAGVVKTKSCRAAAGGMRGAHLASSNQGFDSGKTAMRFSFLHSCILTFLVNSDKPKALFFFRPAPFQGIKQIAFFLPIIPPLPRAFHV